VSSGCSCLGATRIVKIFVTGGSGFIGSALIRFLLGETDVEVVNIDKLTYAGNPASLAPVADDPRYHFERADICDAASLERLFQRHAPDGVVHLAAESHVDRSIDDPEAFLQTNVIGTFRLLETSLAYYRELPGDRKHRFRFLHVSTDEVYGDLGPERAPSTETTTYAPSSPYAASKAGADHLVNAWQRTFGLPTLMTNCSNNYGPYQFPEKLIPHMILSALAGQPLPVYGDGRQVRDWLYVDDHARALWTVLRKGAIGETYNVGGNNEMRNIEVVRLICRTLQDQVPEPGHNICYEDLITFVEDRPGHDARYAIDASKIQNELGWSPRESFETGLRKTVAWYLDNERWWQPVLDGSYRLERRGVEEAGS